MSDNPLVPTVRWSFKGDKQKAQQLRGYVYSNLFPKMNTIQPLPLQHWVRTLPGGEVITMTRINTGLAPILMAEIYVPPVGGGEIYTPCYPATLLMDCGIAHMALVPWMQGAPLRISLPHHMQSNASSGTEVPKPSDMELYANCANLPPDWKVSFFPPPLQEEAKDPQWLPDEQKVRVAKSELHEGDRKHYNAVYRCQKGFLNTTPGTYATSYSSPIVTGAIEKPAEGATYIDAIIDQAMYGGGGGWELQGVISGGINLKEPPAYRWSGRMRLYAQAVHGRGKRMDWLRLDPDTCGLLISDDYRFYIAKLYGGNNCHISRCRPISPDKPEDREFMSCELELLRSGELDETAEKAVLAQVLSMLGPEPEEVDEYGEAINPVSDEYEYHIDVVGPKITGSAPGIYDWHWSYTENKAAKCTFLADYDLGEWDTQIYEVAFDLPSAEDEKNGKRVSARVRGVESGDGIKFSAYDNYFTYSGYIPYIGEIVEVAGRPGNRDRAEASGSGPIYCFYNAQGKLQVLRFEGHPSETLPVIPTDGFCGDLPSTYTSRPVPVVTFTKGVFRIGGAQCLDEDHYDQWTDVIDWRVEERGPVPTYRTCSQIANSLDCATGSRVGGPEGSCSKRVELPNYPFRCGFTRLYGHEYVRLYNAAVHAAENPDAVFIMSNYERRLAGMIRVNYSGQNWFAAATARELPIKDSDSFSNMCPRPEDGESPQSSAARSWSRSGMFYASGGTGTATTVEEDENEYRKPFGYVGVHSTKSMEDLADEPNMVGYFAKMLDVNVGETFKPAYLRAQESFYGVSIMSNGLNTPVDPIDQHDVEGYDRPNNRTAYPLGWA